MSETNGNNGNENNERLDRIEANLEAVTEKMRELVHAQMRSESRNEAFQVRNQEFQAKQEAFQVRNLEFQAEMNTYRQESEKRLQNTEKNLNYLTQLVRAFGDKSFEFDDKVKKVGEILLSDEQKAA